MKNLKVTVNGIVYDVQVEEVEASAASAAPAGSSVPAPAQAAPTAAPAPKAAAKAEAPAGSETIESPMPGTIVEVSVSVGQSVKKGDTLRRAGSNEDGKRNHGAARRRSCRCSCRQRGQRAGWCSARFSPVRGRG